MTIWILDDCGEEITLFKTQEGALKYFHECLEKFIKDESKREEAMEQMKKKEYWQQYQIYSTETYD